MPPEACVCLQEDSGPSPSSGLAGHLAMDINLKLAKAYRGISQVMRRGMYLRQACPKALYADLGEASGGCRLEPETLFRPPQPSLQQSTPSC